MKHYKIFLAAIAVMQLLPLSADAAKRRARAPKLTPAELLAQAREAFYDYNPELARTKLDEAAKSSKVDADELELLEAKVNRMNDMIQRVEAIEVIDSIIVDREEWLGAYRLSPAAGTLSGADDLERSFNAAPQTAVYSSADGSMMMWGTPKGLAESHRLTDGSWEAPSPLDDVLNNGGTANYPFMLPDGVTLYYATDGDDSLGGLDLYISRRNRDGFASPQNMGMPYNSPFDDYMLAIDEDTGAGWFATDRNQLGDRITIYVFIPAQSRVNLDVDSPDLASRAKLDNIAATRKAGADYNALRSRINAIAPAESGGDDTPDFVFPLPDGRVYTRWDQFKSDRARRFMENYVDAMADYEADVEQLEILRSKYSPADRSGAQAIIGLEKKLRSTRKTLQKIANQVISAEK